MSFEYNVLIVGFDVGNDGGSFGIGTIVFWYWDLPTRKIYWKTSEYFDVGMNIYRELFDLCRIIRLSLKFSKKIDWYKWKKT